jgi:hypothetical protein
VDLKEHNRSLVWNSVLVETVGYALCFLWQDKSAVLPMTTAFPFKNETIQKFRKSPSPTSAIAHIVRPDFGDLLSKRLKFHVLSMNTITMNGVDRNN